MPAPILRGEALLAATSSDHNSPAGDLSEAAAELRQWKERCLATESALTAAEAKLKKRAARDASPSKPRSRSSRPLPSGQLHQSPGPGRLGLGADGKPTARQDGKPGPDMIRLLLVEDDPFQSDAILVLCEQCGYKAQTADSAQTALEMVRAQPEINLVLTDVMMEGTTGYELLCRIRALRSTVSVIMMSAYESIDLVEQVRPRLP